MIHKSETYRIESLIEDLPVGEPRVSFARNEAGAKIEVARMGGRRFVRVEEWNGDFYQRARIGGASC